ncbi:MAG: hypothetical protein V3T17_06230 [Pseudomonadales bacterium]
MKKRKATPKSNPKDTENKNTTELPDSISDRVQLVLDVGLSLQKHRLLSYVLAHHDTWTHQLATNCAVGYPPNRLGELNKEVLPRYGLHIVCHQPKSWLQNRYGIIQRLQHEPSAYNS